MTRSRAARRRRASLGLAGVVLAAVALAGCGTTNVVDTSVDNSLGFQQGDGAVVFTQGHRHQVGDVAGTTLTGSHISIASMRGKIVVVNFWQSDCGPCHGEESGFEQLAKDDAGKGVQFLGINVGDNKAAAVTFERQYGVTYPSIFGAGPALSLQFPGAVPPSTPTTIVIDRSGGIAAKVSGEIFYTTLRSLVDKVSAEPTT